MHLQKNIIEEYNWATAAEFADSAGADIISSSLGYTEFDDPAQNHTYADMGKTAPSTKAAARASAKEMVVVEHAGNSGNSSWHYISAPADADSIITVGAVDAFENYASFSSTGPSADGRIKPTVAAQGQGTYVASPSGGVFPGNGTSFSCPVIAGMVACLWQSTPSATNLQVIRLSFKVHHNTTIPTHYWVTAFLILIQHVLHFYLSTIRTSAKVIFYRVCILILLKIILLLIFIRTATVSTLHRFLIWQEN